MPLELDKYLPVSHFFWVKLYFYDPYILVFRKNLVRLVRSSDNI